MIFGKNHGNMRKRCGNHRFLLVVKVGDLLKKTIWRKSDHRFFWFWKVGVGKAKDRWRQGGG